MHGSRMVALGALLAGCVVYGDDPKWHSSSSSTWSSTTSWEPGSTEGELEVDWRIGSLGCDAAGIVTVEVELGGRATAFDCADETGIVRAESGSYPLTLRGLDADGVVRYDGDGGEVRVRRNELTTAPSVVLYPRRARLDTSWYFEDGRLCAANGVALVEANLFDALDVLQASAIDLCDVAGLPLNGVEPGSYVLLLLGRDVAGEVTHSGAADVEVRAGDRLEFDIMLSPE